MGEVEIPETGMCEDGRKKGLKGDQSREGGRRIHFFVDWLCKSYRLLNSITWVTLLSYQRMCVCVQIKRPAVPLLWVYRFCSLWSHFLGLCFHYLVATIQNRARVERPKWSKFIVNIFGVEPVMTNTLSTHQNAISLAWWSMYLFT
jgi:hypothetical protein